MARIKISFNRDSDSLAADIIEGNGEWSELENQIIQAYNDVSEDCYETHQRRMLNCSYEFHEYNSGDNDMIDTYWKPFATCNSSCPIEDPLFGIDSTDFITRMLQNFDPGKVPQLPQSFDSSEQPNGAPNTAPPSSIEPSTAPSSAPTVRPKVPISRKAFLETIRASSVDPSSRTVFKYPTVTPSNEPTLMPSGNPSSIPSIIPTLDSSTDPSEIPSSIPSASFEVFLAVSNGVSGAELEETFVETILAQLGLHTTAIRQLVNEQHTLYREASMDALPDRILQADSEIKVIAKATQIDCENGSDEKDTICFNIKITISARSYTNLDPVNAALDTEESIKNGEFVKALKQKGIEVTAVRLKNQDQSSFPTSIISELPSENPSESPSKVQSGLPSDVPSTDPSTVPSNSPSVSPSVVPSGMPTVEPSIDPSTVPSALPSGSPSALPSVFPSENPSKSPSESPSKNPSEGPTRLPSDVPSSDPSTVPSNSPSISPSADPSGMPSAEPSVDPSTVPSALPIGSPTVLPFDQCDYFDPLCCLFTFLAPIRCCL